MNPERYTPKIETEKSPPKILKGAPEFFESREENEQEDKGPLYIMMNLESECSACCLKCALPGHRRKMGPPLTLEQRKKVLSKARELGIKELVIVGAGEPSEHFDDLMQPVIEAAHNEGLGTIMFTNGSFLTREQAEFYREHDVSIFVSLDAIDPETYKFLIGFERIKKEKKEKMTLEQVLKNIEMLKEVYGQANEEINGKKVVRLGINVTVVKQNKDQLDQLREVAGDDMQFIVNYPIRRGKFKSNRVWQELVGDEYDELQRLAQEKNGARLQRCYPRPSLSLVTSDNSAYPVRSPPYGAVALPTFPLPENFVFRRGKSSDKRATLSEIAPRVRGRL